MIIANDEIDREIIDRYDIAVEHTTPIRVELE